MTWTSEQVAQLKQLRDRGHSASEIAAVLHVSRNAVLAKIDRLGLPALDHRLRRLLQARLVRAES